VSEVSRTVLIGFLVAVTTALLTVPLFLRLARRCGVVDKPGGRKQHGRVTPLLGGAGVLTGAAAGLVAATAIRHDIDLQLHEIRLVIAGGLVMFLIGLVDDVFKDRLSFQLKLLGQIVGVGVLMWPQLVELVSTGGSWGRWLYQLFFLCWYLTIVNSFNFSDNMNGLMSGLSIIAFAAAVVYLGHQESVRSMVIAFVFVGALVGFLPYNFPRSRIFLGDAGSMLVGYWMAWVQFDVSRGFLGPNEGLDAGFSALIPGILIMGVPLYDAAFVVVMRLVEGRPVYLGDNHHLSHRLVRGGFTEVEAVFMLWGLGIVLAGFGIIAALAYDPYRYLLFLACLLCMIAITRLVMAIERSNR